MNSMKLWLTVLCICIAQMHVVLGNLDEECEEEFEESDECYFNVTLKMAMDNDSWIKMVKNVNDCFVDNKCATPNYNHTMFTYFNKNVQTIFHKFEKEWDNTSQVVKKCLMEKVAKPMVEEVSACMAKKNVSDFNASYLFDDDDYGQPFDMVEDGTDDEDLPDAIKMLTVAEFNLVRSMRVCKDHNATAGALVEKCVNGYMLIADEQFCDQSKSCRSDHTITPKCRDRADKIDTGICLCARQKLDALISSIDGLRKKDVGLFELIQAMAKGHDLLKYVNDVSDCYNGHEQGSMITMAIEYMKDKLMHNGKSTVTATGGDIVIGKADLDTFRHFLAAEAFDNDDCDACPT